jgi:GntR family transcriptional repressor for pyruvate dehydrogenase complex
MNLALLRSEMKPMDTSSLVDKVEESLVDLLQKRKLSVGDVIPKRNGTSRNTWSKQNGY